MTHAENFFLSLIQAINEKLEKAMRKEKDPKVREYYEDYCKAHRLLYSQMSTIAGEYGNVVNNLHEIRRNLDTIQGIRTPNISVLENVRSIAGGVMRTIEDAKANIESNKSEISKYQSKVRAGLGCIKKERGRDTLLQVFESIAKAFPLTILGVAAAGELITYELLVNVIATAANPIFALFFACAYAATSQLIKHFRRKEKKKELTKGLEEVQSWLTDLFHQADTFSRSHLVVFQDLTQYLITVNTTVTNLNGVGEINVETATKNMLEETTTIQDHFTKLRNQAQENADKLRGSLRHLDSKFLVGK